MTFSIICAIIFFTLILSNNWQSSKLGQTLKYTVITMFLFSLYSIADQTGIVNDLIPKELDQAISWIQSKYNLVRQQIV